MSGARGLFVSFQGDILNTYLYAHLIKYDLSLYLTFVAYLQILIHTFPSLSHLCDDATKDACSCSHFDTNKHTHTHMTQTHTHTHTHTF